MSFRIGFDASAAGALRYSARTSQDITRAMTRISSGKRINSAADDAAGLAISMRMRGQISGLAQAGQNIKIGQGLVDVGEGALGEAHSILQRVRELATQWNSGIATDEDKASITAEVQQLETALTALGTGTSFNGINMLNSTAAVATLQVGPNAGDTIAVNGRDLAADVGTSVSAFSSALSTATIDIGLIDDAINAVSVSRATFGAVSKRLDHAFNNSENMMYALMDAESRISDADIARESMNLTTAQIKQESSLAMLAQANQSRRNVLALLMG